MISDWMPPGPDPQKRDGSSVTRRLAHWLEPQLARDVRERIACQLYRAAWTPLTILAVLAQVAILITVGLREPTRYVPGFIWLLALLIAREVTRRRDALSGLWYMVLGLVATTTAAVLAHSVHTPAYWTNILALIVVVPLYGARMGILLTLWCALSGASWFLLARFGWTVGLVYPPDGFAYVFLVGCLFCGVGLMTIPTRLLANALTSSEQRRSEAEAAHRAEQDAQLAFRAVFEQGGALSMLVEPSGSIIRLNLSGAKLLGLDRATCVGQSIFDLAWAGQDAVLQIEQALCRATQGTERLHLDVIGPTGSRHLQLAISPLKGADGSLRAFVVAGLDATRLVEAERDLAHARRLEALGQLAGGVAHDFNNMLMAAQGSLESLREGTVSREERLEALETIEQATHRAAELTRKLLAFGRRDRFEKQIVDLAQLVTEAAKLFRRAIGASIQLVLDVGTDSMPVEGDAASIEHALMNLMVNARDAMPNGGTVTIRVSVVTVDDDWCKSQTFSVRPGRLVELCIEDDGMGMNDETRARMFEPFFTTKRQGAGSGLGLSAVHGTVLSHGGGISVESQVGRGTRIHLFFPVAAQRPSARIPTSGVGYSLSLTGTVLVVDDEPLVLRVTKRSLEALGITAILASDVPSAIATLRTGRSFDCVLTDIVMPKLSGVALVEHIRAICPDLPVVVMSGFPATAENPTPEALMGCPWLRKPFGRDELARVLGPILSGAQERRAGAGQLGW